MDDGYQNPQLAKIYTAECCYLCQRQLIAPDSLGVYEGFKVHMQCAVDALQFDAKHRTGHRTHVGSPARYAAAIKDKLVKRNKVLFERLKQERRDGQMLINQLKGFVADRLDLDELVSLYAFAGYMARTYEELTIKAPEWLPVKTKEVKREIERRTQDERERKLAELKARRAALATPDEKRTKLDAEIAALEAGA